MAFLGLKSLVSTVLILSLPNKSPRFAPVAELRASAQLPSRSRPSSAPWRRAVRHLDGWRPRSAAHASSNRKRLPSTLAARAMVRKVTDSFFGSNRRSSAARLVRIARAMSDLDIRFSPIPRSTCHAITRFKAAASASVSVPSSARSSSSEDPRCLRLFNLLPPICACGPTPDRDLISASAEISSQSRAEEPFHRQRCRTGPARSCCRANSLLSDLRSGAWRTLCN